MRAIDRWLALSGRQRRQTCAAVPTVAAAVLYIRFWGIKRALSWAEGPLGANRDESTEELVMAVSRAARYVPGASCLPRSIALVRTLRKGGVPASVRLGVNNESEFTAHAWVEIDAVPVGETPIAFAPLPTRR